MSEKTRRAGLWAAALLAATSALAGNERAVSRVGRRNHGATGICRPRRGTEARVAALRRSPPRRPRPARAPAPRAWPPEASRRRPRPPRRASASASSGRTSRIRARSRPTRRAPSGPRSSSSASTGACARSTRRPATGTACLNADPDVFFASVAQRPADLLAARALRPALEPLDRDRPELRRHARPTTAFWSPSRAARSISNGDDLDLLVLRARPGLPGRATPGFFFDVGTLGVDANALVVGGNLFDDTGAYQGTSVHVAPQERGRLRAPAAIWRPAAASSRTATSPARPAGTGPYTPQGADNLVRRRADVVLGDRRRQRPPRDERARPARRSRSALRARGRRRRSRPTRVLAVPTTALPLSVPHLGNTGGADGRARRARRPPRSTRSCAPATSGPRTTSPWMRPARPDDSGDRDGARWYEIDVTGGSPSVVQSGTLFDAAASNPRSYWIPSIMVSGQGHAAVGASAAGAAEHANAVTAGRLAVRSGGNPPDSVALHGERDVLQPRRRPRSARAAGATIRSRASTRTTT